MTQMISYRIRFTFPEGDDERERMLPSINLFLRALEEADRMIAGSLGLELDYRRALKEMGESHFFYSITLNLRWPPQILLGSWPEPEALRDWMERVRRNLVESAGGNADTGKMAEQWDGWARSGGLADSLVYTPPPAGRLDPLLDDLDRALATLGGNQQVTLS